MRILLPALALVAASLLAGCSGSDDPPAHDPGTDTVTIRDNAFEPRTISVQQGDSVLFQNKDDATHGVKLDSGERSIPSIAPGKEASFTLPTPGSHAFHCPFHPAMRGTILVLEA